jgi:hypothetical protein
MLKFLFIGEFCHEVKFTFLKSTFNSASFDVGQDWVVTFFSTFIRPYRKFITFPQAYSDLKIFSPVLGTIHILNGF